MKSLLRLGLVAIGLLWAQSAFAANCTAIAYASAPGTWASTATWKQTSGGTTCTYVTGLALVFDANTAAGVYEINASTGIAALTTTAAVAGPPPAGVIIQHDTGATLSFTTGGVTYDFTGISYCTVSAGACTGPVVAARAITLSHTSLTASIKTGSVAGSGATSINQLGTVNVTGSGGTTELLDGAIIQGVVTVATGATLDATTNNPNISIASLAGTAGTINCGTGTWTLTGATGTLWSFGTGQTFSCSSTTFAINNTSPTALRTFSFVNGGSYGAFSIGAASSQAAAWPVLLNEITAAGSVTLASLAITGPATVLFSGNTTSNITAAPTWTGASGSQINIENSNLASSNPAIIALGANAATFSWVSLGYIKFTDSSGVTATNSFDLGSNSISGGGALSITPPSGGGGGGGGHIIGG